MNEKKVTSLKIVFEDGDDYSPTCQVGLDKDELAQYIERAFKSEPAGPLIKDEKIRKAVRAWAEALDLRWFRRCGSVNAYTSRLTGHDAEGVCYTMELKPKDLYGDKITKDSYTLTELCGEEEE